MKWNHESRTRIRSIRTTARKKNNRNPSQNDPVHVTSPVTCEGAIRSSTRARIKLEARIQKMIENQHLQGDPGGMA
jgi:hypothetical protein